MLARRLCLAVPRFLALCGLTLAIAALASAGAGRASAQAPAPAPGAPKLPGPETVTLKTKDGVNIVATYLASTKGKDAVAVILLHMFKGNRHDVEGLGKFLQEQGHAVIMPDLRGHGDSTTVDNFSRKLEAATMPAPQFPLMIQDLEAVKSFLVERNNASQLNIERLCVVAAEMSVPVAMNWAALDWTWKDLPNLKQGRDVKALVLLSPTVAFKTANAAQTLTARESPLREQLSIFFIAGAEDLASAREAARMHDQLERHRPKPEKIEDKTLFLDNTLKTKLVGTKLLDEASLGVRENIAKFIELRLVSQPWPWTDRTRK